SGPTQESILDPHGLNKRLGIIKDNLFFEADEMPLCIQGWLEGLDGFKLATVLEHRVLRPCLDVGCPGNQRCTVPEADGLAIPLRNLLDVLPAYQNLPYEVVRDSGQELHLMGGRGQLKNVAP